MARVLPSRAVAFIVSAFPWVEDPSKRNTRVSHSQKAHVAALLDLVDAIPDELLVLRDDDYVGFRVVLSEFRSVLAEWVRFDSRGGAPVLGGNLVVGDGDNPIAYLWRLLRKCPDEAAATDEHGLEFVLDSDLRRGILVDLGAIQRALSNSEWKATTVLAGSVIEALLLDTLLSLEDPQKKVAKKAADDIQGKSAPTDFQRWDLVHYIAGARSVGLITDTTAKSCTLAKDFRNFIHPGRELRLGTPCTRGTAHIALGALDHVMRDLSQQQS